MPKKTKYKNLTLQFVPFTEIQNLSSYKKVKRLLDLIEEKKILIIQGKLNPEEETDLIEETMHKIRKSKSGKFRGIELAVFSPKLENVGVIGILKKKIADVLVGQRDVLTIIGPATVVKEIKKDPTRMQLLLRA